MKHSSRADKTALGLGRGKTGSVQTTFTKETIFTKNGSNGPFPRCLFVGQSANLRTDRPARPMKCWLPGATRTHALTANDPTFSLKNNPCHSSPHQKTIELHGPYCICCTPCYCSRCESGVIIALSACSVLSLHCVLPKTSLEELARSLSTFH